MTLRRSHDRRSGKDALHLVIAWATEHALVVGQVATDAKSNEITAIPRLLQTAGPRRRDRDDRRDGLPDRDRDPDRRAGRRLRPGPQGQPRAPARASPPGIRRREAAAGTTLPLADLAAHTTVEKGHGRIDRRRCRAIGDPAYLAFIDPDGAWPHLRSVVCIESTRRIGDAVSIESRHYLSRLGRSPRPPAWIRGNEASKVRVRGEMIEDRFDGDPCPAHRRLAHHDLGILHDAIGVGWFRRWHAIPLRRMVADVRPDRAGDGTSPEGRCPSGLVMWCGAQVSRQSTSAG